MRPHMKNLRDLKVTPKLCALVLDVAVCKFDQVDQACGNGVDVYLCQPVTPSQ